MARCWLADGRCGRLGAPCPARQCIARTIRRLHERRGRDRLGLFVAEGEDLVEAAAAAGIEPVELLVAGEMGGPALPAEGSTLAHPPRVVGVFRAGGLPRGTRSRTPAPWRRADPGDVRALVRTAD